MTTANETAGANDWEEALIADARANGGRPSGGPLAGHPLMLLYSTGARTGSRRRSILTYSLDGDAFVVTGTAGGAPVAPAWVANLRADAQVELEIGTEAIPATAAIVEGPERDRLWAQHVQQLPHFAGYPAQVGSRVIPVIRLTRRGE